MPRRRRRPPIRRARARSALASPRRPRRGPPPRRARRHRRLPCASTARRSRSAHRRRGATVRPPGLARRSGLFAGAASRKRSAACPPRRGPPRQSRSPRRPAPPRWVASRATRWRPRAPARPRDRPGRSAAHGCGSRETALPRTNSRRRAPPSRRPRRPAPQPCRPPSAWTTILGPAGSKPGPNLRSAIHEPEGAAVCQVTHAPEPSARAATAGRAWLPATVASSRRSCPVGRPKASNVRP